MFEVAQYLPERLQNQNHEVVQMQMRQPKGILRLRSSRLYYNVRVQLLRKQYSMQIPILLVDQVNQQNL